MIADAASPGANQLTPQKGETVVPQIVARHALGAGKGCRDGCAQPTRSTIIRTTRRWGSVVRMWMGTGGRAPEKREGWSVAVHFVDSVG
jgi:hypothetical protein